MGDRLYPQNNECFICHTPFDIHNHHVYPGNGRREVSEREGCVVQLCAMHHNMSNRGVHFDRRLDAWLRADCQRRWEQREGLSGDEAHDAFRKVFGISYL